MARICDEQQQRNLLKNEIEIQTKYLDGTRTIIKSTNEKNNDLQSVNDGIVLEKLFFKKGRPVKKLTGYDSRIQYRFITPKDETTSMTCPNCGFIGKGNDFIDGCPYCGTFYNMNYQDKVLGTKYYYDQVMKNEHYLLITFLVDLFFSILFMFTYIKNTSRTFNEFDLAKIGVEGILLALVLFGVFYMLDAFIITLPVKMYKEAQNQKQRAFWEQMKQRGIDQNRLLNQFHANLRNNLYQDETLIDYNMIDYENFACVKHEKIKITVNLRLVYDTDKGIITKNETREYTLHQNKAPVFVCIDGVNLLTCSNCGASINVSDGSCKYCGTKIGSLLEWEIVL